jgi:hypothetical protein
MNIKKDYNLRENADIVHLAMKSAKSLDSTELKEWFDNKYSKPIHQRFLLGLIVGLVISLITFSVIVYNLSKDTKDYYETDITKTTIKAHKQ